MRKKYILSYIKELERPVFTTHELAMVSGKSLSAVTQALCFLEQEGLVFKIYRGIWGETGNKQLSAYSVIPFLFPRHRAYVSFVSALHMYGIIEQIPQTITLASMIHTRTIRTALGTFSVHKIAPSFFTGYDWYKGTGSFLIAEQEKAFIDSLYLSSCKKKQFGHFPELHFPETFSIKKTENWAKKINNPKVKISVQKKLKEFLTKNKSVLLLKEL